MRNGKCLPAFTLPASESIGGIYQSANDAGLSGRMTSIGDDVELGLRPSPMEIPGTHHRANNIVPPLDDYARNVANLFNILDYVIVSFEETGVDEVVALHPRDCQGDVWLSKVID